MKLTFLLSTHQRSTLGLRPYVSHDRCNARIDSVVLDYGKLVSRRHKLVDILHVKVASGFMKHPPNLLKQESSGASTLATVLLRLYFDPRPAHQAIRPQVTERLLPLGMSVLQDFNKLRSDTQMKNIMAWAPVVAEIVHGFTRLDGKAVSSWIPPGFHNH